MTPTAATVRDHALAHPDSIRVFEKYGIDYCCGGRKPLAQACDELSLDLSTVLADLEDAAHGGGKLANDWTSATLESLCNHIVEAHHDYIRRELPRLYAMAQKVVTRHGDTHPELVRIQQLLSQAGEELLQHLSKEEQILFPSIINLERNTTAGGLRSLGCFGAMRNPIRVMMAEHDSAGEALAEMRRLSHNFTPPQGACPTYQGYFLGLAEFEKDLHQHVHLENNILFPRAIEADESSL